MFEARAEDAQQQPGEAGRESGEVAPLSPTLRNKGAKPAPCMGKLSYSCLLQALVTTTSSQGAPSASQSQLELRRAPTTMQGFAALVVFLE